MKYLVPATAVLGMVLGSGLLVVVAWVYATTQTFGLGGSVLTLFGVILVGLSIWSTVTISVSPEGGLEARFDQRLQSLDWNVRQVDQSVSQLRSEMISTVSAIQNIPPEQVDSLRKGEAVDRLIAAGKHLEALELEPGNIIAISRYIEQQVAQSNYREATQYYQRLQDANDSGVGYTAYPSLALAFERIGEGKTALSVLRALDQRVTDEITRGYGYHSRSRQIDWVRRDLLRVRAHVQDQWVAGALDTLARKLGETIAELRAG